MNPFLYFDMTPRPLVNGPNIISLRRLIKAPFEKKEVFVFRAAMMRRIVADEDKN